LAYYLLERGRLAVRRNANVMIQNTNVNDRPTRSSKASPALDEARLRQQAIGVKLRQIFDEVVSEPVPDEFLDILRRGDAKNSEGA
jgi:hypothetical protein